MKRERIDKAPFVRLMLDSGAFSVWQKGAEIDIDRYIKFVKRNKQWIDTYFNLDVIGGRRGHKRTEAQVEQAAKLSYENLQYMKERGLSPIPVYHEKESFYWLEKLVADGEPYIALAPFKELRTADQMKWLDQCFTMLTDTTGAPIVKTHGLGVASFSMLFRYPWTSCDATSWVWISRYGKVLIPQYRHGEPTYDKPPTKVHVSNWKKDNGEISAESFTYLSPKEKDRVVHYLESHVGVSLSDVHNDYYARDLAVMTYFRELGERKPELPFRHRVVRLIR